MDITLLKTFIFVARTRHFGKAAGALHVTQSAVSARIRLLESKLGVKLFTRDRNNIQLTIAGERLGRHADMIIAGWERARLDIALESSYTQSLAIGTTIDLWHINVRNWIDQLYISRPDLALHLDMNKADDLVNSVLDSVLDMAFIYEPPTTPDLIARQLEKIPLVLVSSEPTATIETALASNYLLVEWGPSFAKTHAAFVEERCIPRAHCSSGEMALDLLLSQGGACYLAKQMVNTHITNQRLHLVPEAPVIERFSYAIFKADNENSELLQSIITTL